eukprot:6181247-Pleurochrysis_carterae.AAC.6
MLSRAQMLAPCDAEGVRRCLAGLPVRARVPLSNRQFERARATAQCSLLLAVAAGRSRLLSDCTASSWPCFLS